jgi:hypothetical protein
MTEDNADMTVIRTAAVVPDNERWLHEPGAASGMGTDQSARR